MRAIPTRRQSDPEKASSECERAASQGLCRGNFGQSVQPVPCKVGFSVVHFIQAPASPLVRAAHEEASESLRVGRLVRAYDL